MSHKDDLAEMRIRRAVMCAEKAMNTYRNPQVRDSLLEIWIEAKRALALYEETTNER